MKRFFAGIALALLWASNAGAFDLSSPDVAEGKVMKSAQVYKGFGCNGGNISPALMWKNPPTGARSFAVTVYDPDTPTGSGWWHWVVYDVPAATFSLPAGAAVMADLPTGAKQGRNDYGERNFGGACPPAGDKPHRYVFTVYALKVEKLGVAADASPAMIGFMLNSNSLGKAQLTAIWSR